MGFIIFLAFVGAIVAFVILRKGESVRFETQAAPSQVIMAATAAVGTGRRWAVAQQSENYLIFNYVKKPSKLVAMFGLFFFLVPGIVYLVLAGKKETLSLQIDRSTGNTIVQATSNGFRGKFAAREIRKQLGVAVGSTAVTHASVIAAQSAPALPTASPATPLATQPEAQTELA